MSDVGRKRRFRLQNGIAEDLYAFFTKTVNGIAQASCILPVNRTSDGTSDKATSATLLRQCLA
jgi:hypothetical protein